MEGRTRPRYAQRCFESGNLFTSPMAEERKRAVYGATPGSVSSSLASLSSLVETIWEISPSSLSIIDSTSSSSSSLMSISRSLSP